jgi:hypothetical protein
MKVFISMVVYLMVAYSACKNATNRTPVFLPGIYVNATDDEFRAIADTIVVHKISLIGDDYQITRKTSYCRVKSGKRSAAEYQQQHWVAKYDENTGMLQSADSNKALRYLQEENTLYKGSILYEKVE